MVSVSSSVNRCLVDSFSEAAATKDHKLSGLKQQQFILSQLERPESQVKLSAGHLSWFLISQIFHAL